MAGEVMYGKCDVCGKEGTLIRTYFHFPEIKCECHSPNHFEIVDHCKDCKPKLKSTTKLEIKTSHLQAMSSLVELHKGTFQIMTNVAEKGSEHAYDEPTEPISHNKVAKVSNGCEAMYLDN